MPSQDSLQVRGLLALGDVRQTGTDEPIAIRLRKVGSETATSVTVVSATSLALVGSTTTDTYLFATYTTIGSLVDKINADGRWEAKAVDTLRSLASVNNLLAAAPVTAGTDENGVVIWDVKTDTSASLQISVGLTPRRNFDAPKGHRVHVQQVVYSVNMGTAAVDSFQIWRRRGATETQVFGQLSVDTTETTLNLASGVGKISGRDEDEFVVLVKDAATLADAAGNFVRVIGTIE
jgi:hypothetical protein